MDGLILLAVVGLVALFMPGAEKPITKKTQKATKERIQERQPNTINLETKKPN